MGVGGQRHAPAALSLGKTQYPLYRRLGGPQGRSVRMKKISPLNVRITYAKSHRFIASVKLGGDVCALALHRLI